ncbi:MAG: serine/threonine protein kinase [Gemmataceae bacterium]|nr:serine/threonine protein kinase [Gemmataceae bacterium]
MTTSDRTQTAPPDLLAAAEAAGLWTPGQAAKARATDGSAEALVAAGLLTRFQADRLLAGRADGFVLDGYVIQDQLGKGPAGRAYKAVHRAMNRAVAIDLLRADLTGTADARELFDREARAAARLNHPNVVTTYDANRVGDRCYLVRECVDGPSFAALVAERGPLPVAEACELIRQAAVGLGHAHENGLAHRSLSPDAVLVARPSKSLPGCAVKVGGWGVGRLAAADPDYAAPEQAADPAGGDHRADLYALGGVFYFLLTGRPPFPGGDAADKLRRHRTTPPEPVGRVRPDVPPAVAEVVHRLLAKDPNTRLQSAAGVAARVDGLAAGAVEVEDDGAFISFDLPEPRPGRYSRSGICGLTEVVRQPPPREPAGDTCPWAQITAEMARPTVADPTPAPEARQAEPAPTPEPAPRRGVSVGVLAAAGVLVLAAGVGLGYAAVRLAG